jgi:uncharacterized protein (DUF58 family)
MNRKIGDLADGRVTEASRGDAKRSHAPFAARRSSLLDPAVLASIGRLDLVARTVVEGFLAGLHRSPFSGLSQEFAQHRQYIPGDDPRHIDWRVYARTDRLYVKEFEDETNAPVRLLLDASGSLGYAPRGVSKFDYARFLLAALAYLAVRQNDRVGFVAFNDEARERLRASGGQRHLHTILAALGRLRPAGHTRLGPIMLREASQWKRRGLVVVVSDLYDEPPEVVGAITRIRRAHHDVIVFHLLDRAEKLMEHDGLYEFRDLETGQTLVADSSRVRQSYVERMAGMCSYYRREFGRAGVDYAELDTAEPLERALAIYLQRRAK